MSTNLPSYNFDPQIHQRKKAPIQYPGDDFHNIIRELSFRRYKRLRDVMAVKQLTYF